MTNLNLTEDEEKAMVGMFYNSLSFGTTLEVFNQMNEDGVRRLDVLRGAFTKLLQKYSLVSNLSQEDCLLLGLSQLINKESLKKWSANENNKHLYLRAKYFLDKSR